MTKPTNSNSGRPLGENALERTVRLLKKLNERFADPDVADMAVISIAIDHDGSCYIRTEGLTLASFSDTERLMKFLEAPIAQQVKTIRVA